MRDKRRYLLVEASGKIAADEKTFSNAIQRELLRCIGEISYHEVNPKLMKILDDNHFIMRASLEGIGRLILAFALVKGVDNAGMSFYTLKSSGTMRAVQR